MKKPNNKYGRWKRPSTYHPGNTTRLNGKITTEVSYDEPGEFKQWAAAAPSDPDSAEEELDYDALPCYLWLAQEGHSIPVGWRVTCEWIGGRWYVVGAEDCPEEE